MRRSVAYILVLLSLILLYLAYAESSISPAVTAVGFVFIAVVFFRQRRRTIK